MLRKLIVFGFLLVLPAVVSGQDNTQDSIVEIKRIDNQIKSFEENLTTFEKFSENFLAETEAQGLAINDDLLFRLFSFDITFSDLSFKILITRGVFESLSGPVPRDPFVEQQLGVLNTMNKPPLEFVRDMLSIIEERIDF